MPFASGIWEENLREIVMKRLLWPILVAFLFLGTASPGWTFLSGVVAETNFWHAVQAYQNQHYDTVVALLEREIQSGVDDARVRNLLGWTLFKRGEYARAKTEFRRVLHMEPDELTGFLAYEGLGWVAQKTGDYDRAIAAFNESLRLHPDYYGAYNGLGWSYIGKRNLPEAEKHFNAALQSEPESIDAVQGLGFVAYHLGQWEEAIRLFGDVLRVKKGDTVTQSALAWAYFYTEEFAKASQIFRNLMESEPTWADPLLGLAWIAEKEGHPNKAKPYFQSAIEKSATYVATSKFQNFLIKRPEWMDLWRDLGWALYYQRNYTRAEVEFQAFLKLYPDDASGLRGLGYSLYALKRYQEAVPPLERSLALKAALPPVREQVRIPGTSKLQWIMSDAASTLAWSYHYTGNFSNALQQFVRVTKKHPDWADPWSGIGWTLLKIGDKEGAERAFRRSMKARSDYLDASSGLKAVQRGGQ
jgi:tetratricopeptide (TPR) repeat protein